MAGYIGTKAVNLSTTGADIAGDAHIDGDLSFRDNDKAIFGAGSDLTISHDTTGTAGSYITESGTGSLNIRGNNVIFANSDGSNQYGKFFNGAGVEFNYANATKLATTATGIDVTGNATFADNGKAIFGAGSDLQIYHDGSNSIITDAGTGNLIVKTNGNNIQFEDGSGNDIFKVTPTATNIYHGASGVKLETTSTGVDITGVLTSNKVTIDNGLADGDILTFKKDGVAVATIGVNSNDNIYFAGEAGNTAGIYLNNAALLPADTGGTPVDNHVNLGTASNRWSNLYVAGGVAFGDAGGSGTSTSNLLDSYEEGTWNLGVAAPGVTLTSGSIATGRYTKIGNSVTLHCLVTPTSATSSSSYFDITGLPFAPANSAVGAVMSQYVQGAGQQLVCLVPGSASIIRFYETDSDAWTRLRHSDITTNSDMYITVTYMTS